MRVRASLGKNRGDLALEVVRLEVVREPGPVQVGPEPLEVLALARRRQQVGVLPEVDSDDRRALDQRDSVHQRVVLVIGLSDNQLAVLG